MRPPTLNQFITALEELIENAPSGKLKEIIYTIANEIQTEERNDFLQKITQVTSGKYKNQNNITRKEAGQSADALLTGIENFRNRIEEGEFYDEERDYEAYHRNEYRYYGHDDDYEDTDFSGEEYVLEMIELLGGAEDFYHTGNVDVAFKAYQGLFDMMEDEKYEYDEYFIDGFSFKEAIGESVYNAHKILFLRLFYLFNINHNRNAIFSLFRQQQDIFLSAIVDVDTAPLKDIDNFVDEYINYLSNLPKYAKHLIDCLFVKGGIDSLEKFAYKNGHKIPATFLAYYIEQKERNISQDKLLKIINDGLEIIPEKYASKSILSNDLVDIAKSNNDTDLLSKAYTTAFYSYPTLKNLDSYLGFITQKTNREKLHKFEQYIENNKKILKKQDEWPSSFDITDVYSFSSVSISRTTYLISDFILHGIVNQLQFLDEEKFLGFQNENRHIPIILSLLFQTIVKSKKVKNIDALTNHYCFDNTSEKYDNLKQLIYSKAKDLSLNSQINEAFETAEKITLKRVQHILGNKLRGGYETSCLLLVAFAETKEIQNKTGNQLISLVDSEYKRFSAFRRELKALTQKSSQLITVR